MEKNMYLDYEPDVDAYKENLIEQMEEQREEVIGAIKLILRQDISSAFSKILVSAYEYGCPEAKKIVDDLGLTQQDIYAIEEDFENYEEIANQINEARYCSSMEG
jgi:hypothetical protein